MTDSATTTYPPVFDENNPFKVTQWDVFGIWYYDTAVKSCGICRNDLMDTSRMVQDENYGGYNKTRVSLGKCGHVYHYSCIRKWVDDSSGHALCPQCGLPWEFNSKMFDKQNYARFIKEKQEKFKKCKKSVSINSGSFISKKSE